MKLTKEQQEAVYHYKGPAIVIAGPGSGKTRVLTERVKFLIKEKQVLPERILVTTFTEKAATELKHRLYGTLEAEAKHIHVSTIHSLCSTILEDYFTYHEFGSQFRIMDSEAQQLFIEANKSPLGLGGKKGWLDIVHANTAYSKDPAESICRLYNFLTDNNVRAEILKDDLKEQNQLNGEMEKLLDSYLLYCSLLIKEKLMDFSHLQIVVYRLLENEQACRELQNRFDFILVDEYQDTSPVQDMIFHKLVARHRNLFIVGDENQSIYGFRGASVENFITFPERNKDTSQYFLSTNFRSTRQIVQASNNIFEGKIKKELQAHRDKGNKILLIRGRTRLDAAEKLAAFIRTLNNEKQVKYGNTALLCRTKTIMEPYIDALKKNKIPYMAADSGRFDHCEEIQGILNLFNYVTCNENLDSRFRDWKEWWNVDIFASPVTGFNPATLKILGNLSKETDISGFTESREFADLGIKSEQDILKLTELNKIRAADKKNMTNLEVLYAIFRATGYLAVLLAKEDNENEEKLHNLARLTRIIDSFDNTIKRPGNERLLKHIYYKSQHNQFHPYTRETDDSVKVITVHKAKGLEFPIVVICSFIEGDFPLRFREDLTVCGIPVAGKFRLNDKQILNEELHYNEELRLFYVALTRAQDLLIITESEKITTKTAVVSRFKTLIEAYLDEEGEQDIRVEKEYTPPVHHPVLSYSSLKNYLECPFHYRLQYIYDFAYPQSLMQQQGIIVHNVLQRINEHLRKQIPLAKEEIARYVDDYWLALGLPGKKVQELKKIILDNCWVYYTQTGRSWQKILSLEKPFSHIDENIQIRGKTDLIAVDTQGRKTLIDFKSRTKEGIKLTGVEEQLNFYNFCLKDEGLERIAAYTFFDHEMTDFPIDREKIAGLLEKASMGIREGNFKPQPGPAQCRKDSCAFGFICKELQYV